MGSDRENPKAFSSDANASELIGTLTVLQSKGLRAVRRYHEDQSRKWASASELCSRPGVMGSLVRRGLVRSTEQREHPLGERPFFYRLYQITSAGRALLSDGLAQDAAPDDATGAQASEGMTNNPTPVPPSAMPDDIEEILAARKLEADGRCDFLQVLNNGGDGTSPVSAGKGRQSTRESHRRGSSPSASFPTASGSKAPGYPPGCGGKTEN